MSITEDIIETSYNIKTKNLCFKFQIFILLTWVFPPLETWRKVLDNDAHPVKQLKNDANTLLRPEAINSWFDFILYWNFFANISAVLWLIVNEITTITMVSTIMSLIIKNGGTVGFGNPLLIKPTIFTEWLVLKFEA